MLNNEHAIFSLESIVVDPVMISTSRKPLLCDEGCYAPQYSQSRDTISFVIKNEFDMKSTTKKVSDILSGGILILKVNTIYKSDISI
jgi:hydroxymethylpyrimidine/phosphomethylpyrimidine kinase